MKTSENLFFCGKRIRLRALEPEDLDILYRWENDTTCWEAGCTLEPLSRYALKCYIANAGDLYTQKQLRLMITTQDANGEAIGSLDVFDYDPFHQRAAIGILIDPAFRNQGIAQEALRLLIDYLFRFLHLRLLYAYIPEKNLPSRKLFASCGFSQSGILRQWLQNSSGYEDVRIVQLLSTNSNTTTEDK